MKETISSVEDPTPEVTGSKAYRLPLWGWYWILCLPALLKSLGSGPVFFGRAAGCELTETHLYLQTILGRLIREGLPMWNSWFACGYPMVGDWRLGLFHPVTLLHYLLPPYWVINVVLIFSTALAATFMFRLGRVLSLSPFAAWIAGLAYGFSGHLAGYGWLIGEYNYSLSYPFVPLVLSEIVRVVRTLSLRAFCLATLGWGLVLVGGSPPLAVFTLLLATAFAIGTIAFSRHEAGGGFLGRILLVCFIVVLGAAIALPHLQPAWHLWQQTAIPIPMAAAKDYPFDRLILENLVALICPSFFGDEVNSIYWGRLGYAGALGYAGVGIILLAVFSLFARSRTRLPLAVFLGACLGLLLAADAIPIFAPLARVPGWVQAMRSPARWIFLYVFCIALAAGMGWDVVRSWHPLARRRTGIVLLIGAGLALLLAWLFFGRTGTGGVIWSNFAQKTLRDPFSALPPELVAKVTSNEKFLTASFSIAWDSVVRTLLLAGGVGAILAFGFHASSRPRAATVALAGILFATDTVGFFHSLETISPADDVEFSPVVAEYVQQQTQNDWRVLTPYDPDLCLKPLRIPTQTTWARHTFVYRELFDLIRLQERQPSYYAPGLMISRVTPLTDFMAARVVVTRAGTRFEDTMVSKTLGTQSVDVYLVPTALPRASVARNVRVTSNTAEILFSVASLDYQPTATVYLDPGEETVLPDLECSYPPRARVVKETARGLTVELDEPTSQTALLTLADIYDPWWRAWVENRPAKIYKVNYSFRGVILPPGTKTIHFEYRPPGWPLVPYVSLVILIVTILGLLFPSRELRSNEVFQ
ncbi:MAG: hypothetical protein KatS3mg130_1637 [Candidatus Sumerlaea sp.]|nr:MAG: hypothetical protein KatS3mg130_1637 [Candidatus Sumerlaea sp.]